jgi:hypothetical protein
MQTWNRGGLCAICDPRPSLINITKDAEDLKTAERFDRGRSANTICVPGLRFRSPLPFPEARLLSDLQARAPLDDVRLSRIQRPFQRILDLSCWLGGGPPFVRALSERPPQSHRPCSTAANNSSRVTLSVRVQHFNSSAWCILIFERSGCSLLVRFSMSGSQRATAIEDPCSLLWSACRQ